MKKSLDSVATAVGQLVVSSHGKHLCMRLCNARAVHAACSAFDSPACHCRLRNIVRGMAVQWQEYSTGVDVV